MADRTPSDQGAIVGVCLYPGVWASSATLAKDLVHLASSIARSRPGSRSIQGRFLGPQAGDVPTADGTPLPAQRPWDDADVDVLTLPSVALPWLERTRRPSGLTSWVTGQHQRGALVIALGTGSQLLADTGLLDGQVATTHWASVQRCRAEFPAVTWTADQRLAVTGRLVTARDTGAAATAICHAIGRVLGVPIAERTYQYALIHEPGAQALPLLHTVGLRDHGDPQVLQVQQWLETRYREPLTATQAAQLVHMSSRQLRRRFLTATGLTLIGYLTEIRLAHARRLLLSTNQPAAAIAHQVGYHDPSTFTALFKEHHHMTPGTYRATADRILA